MSTSFSSQSNDELKLSRRHACRAGLALVIGVPLSGLCEAVPPANAQESGPASPTQTKPETAADVKAPERRYLLDPKEFPKGWRFFTEEKNAQLATTWQLVTEDPKHPYLKCTGKPFGYLKTLETFGDYEFGLQWRYPSDVAGNSGILLHTADEDRIWPNSIQVQLHRPQTGSVFPSGDAKSDNRLDVKDRDLPRELNVWNDCRIECREGRISVEINGKRIGAVTGCQPAAGAIALQSEGAEVHFQNIWMKPLGKPEQPTA